MTLKAEVVRHFVSVRRHQNVMQKTIILRQGLYWLKGFVHNTFQICTQIEPNWDLTASTIFQMIPRAPSMFRPQYGS